MIPRRSVKGSAKQVGMLVTTSSIRSIKSSKMPIVRVSVARLLTTPIQKEVNLPSKQSHSFLLTKKLISSVIQPVSTHVVTVKIWL